MAYTGMTYDGFSSGGGMDFSNNSSIPTSGGGGGSGGGMMGGTPYGAIINYALGELNREKKDRMQLFSGIRGAMNDGQWLMEHFPNFWGSPSNFSPMQANINENSDVGGMVDAVNIKRGEQAFTKWRMQQERDFAKEDQQFALDRIEKLKNAGAWGSGKGDTGTNSTYSNLWS